jgi:hypothetical protein
LIGAQHAAPLCVWGDSLTRRQIGKIKNLVGRDLFGDIFCLAGVADGVGDELGVDSAVGGFGLLKAQKGSRYIFPLGLSILYGFSLISLWSVLLRDNSHQVRKWTDPPYMS